MSETTELPTPEEAPSELAVRLRQFIDMKARLAAMDEKHKSEKAPLTKAKQLLETRLQELLDASGSDSATVRGVATVYKHSDDSATVGDKEAFRQFLLESPSNLDMADVKANKVAVREFIASNHRPPPGVNFTSRVSIGVRQA